MTDLLELVLGPLAGRPEASWQQAPPGKWTPSQIVEHLALALEMSAPTFASRRAKEPMARRGTTLREKIGKVLAFGLGRFPPGLKAPERTTPPPRVDGHAAEAHFRAALAAWQAVERDLEHPETDSLLNNLATLYKDQGKNEEALPLYQRALAIYEKVFGLDHPFTKRAREDYTNLLQKMGQKTEGVDQQN